MRSSRILMEAFHIFHQKTLGSGALATKTKELIALASAHITGSLCCIKAHTKGAKEAGARDEEIIEAIFIASVMSAAAPLVRSTTALELLSQENGLSTEMVADQIREEVRERYASRVRDTSCCTPSEEKQETIKGEKIVKIAGYSDEELSQLPQGAIKNAIGCGNPAAIADIKEGDVVLDIGAGAGIDVILTAKKVGPTGKVIGLDMTPEMFQEAIKNIQQAGVTNVEFRQGIMEDMPIEGETIDWVISNCVINLSPDKGKVFKEIFRVLKLGGRFVISDIVTQGLSDSIKKSVFGWSCCVGGALDEKVYLEAIRSAGFTDTKVAERVDFTKHMVEALFTVDSTELPRDALIPPNPPLIKGGKGGFSCEKYKNEIAGRITSIMVVGQKPIC